MVGNDFLKNLFHMLHSITMYGNWYHFIRNLMQIILLYHPFYQALYVVYTTKKFKKNLFHSRTEKFCKFELVTSHLVLKSQCSEPQISRWAYSRGGGALEGQNLSTVSRQYERIVLKFAPFQQYYWKSITQLSFFIKISKKSHKMLTFNNIFEIKEK